MAKKMKNIPVTLIALLLIAMIGFKNVGIFIMDFESGDQGYRTGETANITKEREDRYTVEKDGNYFQVPKGIMLKSTDLKVEHKVTTPTGILRLNGSVIRELEVGELLELVELEETQGRFLTNDNIEGYIDLEHIETNKEYEITAGISRVDKTLESGEHTYTLKKGDAVKIVGFQDNEYILLDDANIEYRTSDKDVRPRGPISISRGGKEERTAGNSSIANIVATAKEQLGRPYVSGDTGRRGFDCSGLTTYVYSKAADIKLPRTSSSQATAGKHVDKSNLEAGDLVFFRTSGRGIGHVGIYIGDNNMVHASTGSRSMAIANINSSYFAQRYVTARRVVD